MGTLRGVIRPYDFESVNEVDWDITSSQSAMHLYRILHPLSWTEIAFVWIVDVSLSREPIGLAQRAEA